MSKETRLECLKIAAETSKGNYSTVVEAAKAYASFVEKNGDDTSAVAKKVIKRKAR